MSAILRRAQRVMLLLVATLLGLSLLTPIVALGQSSLTVGSTAVVSAGGDNATLRDDASASANKIGSIPDGTEVFIIDGPIVGSDGGTWYYAGVWDQTGYISGSLLSAGPSGSAEQSSSEAPAEDTSAPSAPSALPWSQPIDYGVVVDNSNSPLPGDGLACRYSASGNAEVIVRLGINQQVEVTGQSVWAEGIEFLPINCGGVGGFVKADYVALNSQQAVEEPAVEEPAVVETEEVVETPAVDPNAPVAGDLIITVLDQNGTAVGGACFALYLDGQWVAEACDSNDSIPNNGNSGFFGIAAGTYTVVNTGSPTGATVDNQQVTIVAGDTAYATVYVVTEAAEVPTEEVVTEEVATEEVVPTEEAVTEEVVTEEPTEEITEEPVTEDPTDVVTEEATEVPSEEATEVPATEEPTDEATEVPTEEATEEPVTEEPTEVATIAPGSDLGEPIGDATVTGTNGEGLRCRVAPDASSAVITTLPEGATVFVYALAGVNYLEINCGGQLGYGDVNYLWTGGAGEDIPSGASSVVVVGTGGQSLNCRSGPGTSYGVVAAVAQGTVLTSRGASTNGWAPVVCNGKNGFVSISYVEVSGSTSTPNTGSGTSTTTSAGTAKVVNTGGDGVRCRTSAPSGAVIVVLREGTVVTTRGAASNGWVPVVCNGQNGFASAAYLSVTSGGGSTTTPTPTPTTPTPGTGTSTGYVKVTGTGGTGLYCRSAASSSGMIITTLPYNSTVATRGAATNGWQPVTCGGKAGYVSAQYVSATTGGGTTDPGTNPGTGTTGTATVTGTGSSLRCRTTPSTQAATITMVPDGTKVTTRGPSENGWTPVTCGGQLGYMSSQYLSSGGGSTTTPTPTPTTPTPGTGSGMVNGDHGKVNSRANMRYQASTNSNVVIIVEAGEVLLITGGASNGFYPVDYDGLKGWMHQDLLNKTNEALSERGGSGEDPDPDPGGGGGATGSSLVNYAMKYLGYPYRSATHGPSSFDCSGFTYWVTKNVMGKNIGTGLWTQVSAGSSVSRSNLQPGDLVFFQNTYKAGLSHVGIYIGNNQFIHAENENTGVRISDLNSTYYSSRWYGAVRLG